MESKGLKAVGAVIGKWLEVFTQALQVADDAGQYFGFKIAMLQVIDMEMIEMRPVRGSRCDAPERFLSIVRRFHPER